MSSPQRPSGVILAYHRLQENVYDPFAMSIPPSLFRRHLQVVRQAFEPVPVAELAQPTATQSATGRRIAITFDDGYLDALLVASPLLVEEGVPATFFMTTQFLHTGGTYWWDALAGRETDPVRCRQVHAEILAAAPAVRAQRICELQAHDVADHGLHRSMNAAQVTELASRPGHRIGAHTVHHPRLTTEPSVAAFRELYESRVELEYLIGKPCDIVAYPFGGVDHRVRQLAYQAGFTAGVTLAGGAVETGADPLVLPRVNVTPDLLDLEEFLEGFFGAR